MGHLKVAYCQLIKDLIQNNLCWIKSLDPMKQNHPSISNLNFRTILMRKMIFAEILPQKAGPLDSSYLKYALGFGWSCCAYPSSSCSFSIRKAEKLSIHRSYILATFYRPFQSSTVFHECHAWSALQWAYKNLMAKPKNVLERVRTF